MNEPSNPPEGTLSEVQESTTRRFVGLVLILPTNFTAPKLPLVVVLDGHLSMGVLPILERGVREMQEAAPFTGFVGVMGTDAGPVVVDLGALEAASIRPLIELFESKEPLTVYGTSTNPGATTESPLVVTMGQDSLSVILGLTLPPDFPQEDLPDRLDLDALQTAAFLGLTVGYGSE